MFNAVLALKHRTYTKVLTSKCEIKLHLLKQQLLFSLFLQVFKALKDLL